MGRRIGLDEFPVKVIRKGLIGRSDVRRIDLDARSLQTDESPSAQASDDEGVHPQARKDIDEGDVASLPVVVDGLLDRASSLDVDDEVRRGLSEMLEDLSVFISNR